MSMPDAGMPKHKTDLPQSPTFFFQMPKIQVLSDILASQVAAGEVVERPASVVKELVENSLDAGASHVLVEIQKGGTALIKVTDNGCGMAKDDALLSLERHATSKLRQSSDLTRIMTMGFRGEAVPSIASVSRFRLASQQRGQVEGTEIWVEGGKIREVKSAGLSDGTVVEAKQLFFNVPARRKFLRTETTESAHVEHQVRLHALSAPQVRFTFKKDGRLVFDLPATEDRRVRILGMNGQAISATLTEVDHHERAGMEVSGFILPAEFSRKGRRQQYVFLNGRPVEDPAISRALRDGYRGAVGEGMHPSAWLWLDMNPGMVDVNVHPAKKEVRFQRPHDVRFLVTEAVEHALSPGDRVKSEPKIVSRMDGSVESVRASIAARNDKSVPAATAGQVDRSEASEKSVKAADPAATERAASVFAVEGKPSWQSAAVQQEITEKPSTSARPDFRALAVLHHQYVLLEGEDGLVVLDPKAARQRIVYEQMLKSAGEVPTQGLLIPEVLDLDAHDFDIVQRNLDHFREAGLEIEVFGGHSLQVSGLPEFVKVSDPRAFVLSLVDGLIETQETKRGKVVAYELFAKQLAKKSAMQEKAELTQVEPLLEQLFRCDLPYCDPAGEPTLIQIALSELARKFGKG